MWHSKKTLHPTRFILFILVLFIPLAAWAGGEESPAPRAYLITLAPGAETEAVLARAWGEWGIQSVQALETERPLFRVRLEADPGLEALRSRAAGEEALRSVQPDFQYSVPTPPRRPEPTPGTRSSEGK